MKTIASRLFLLFLFLSIFFACKKDSFSNSPELQLTTDVDTLHFDTVFTTTGSVTQAFKIFNSNTSGIKVQSVRLAGGDASSFKINVDGTAGPLVTDLEIAANDSAYVFATVKIDPTTADLPFIVKDSIEISYNGNSQFVQLEAFGQNAHFHRNLEITGSETWNNDLPHVILGRLTIDTNAILTINKGSNIYFHADAPFIIHGSLQVNGEKWDSTKVTFTSDRLDDPYRDFPASYPGLIFTDVSKNNELNYAVIKNAYQGIAIINPSPNAAPKLILNQTIIDNAYDAGILAINTSINGQNLLISNCGKNMVLIGGDYNFTHCTVASFANRFLQHKDPVLFVGNLVNNTIPPFAMNATFQNCIFWSESGGFVDNEVVVAKSGTANFNVLFNNVLWRVKNNPANTTVTGNIINDQDPQFDSINTSKPFYNFRLKEGSPAINKGSNTGLVYDLDGAPRSVGLPDLGAYERQ